MIFFYSLLNAYLYYVYTCALALILILGLDTCNDLLEEVLD